MIDFEGIQTETLHRLRDVLSYPLDIPDNRRESLCKWIYDHCINTGNDTVSSLLIHDFGSDSMSDHERLSRFCKRTFTIEAYGNFVAFRPGRSPSEGQFIIIVDFGAGNAVELVCNAQEKNRMEVRRLEFFPALMFDERVAQAKSESLSRALERSLTVFSRTKSQSLSPEETLDVILGVIGHNEALRAVLAARDLEILIGHGEQAEAAQTKPRLHRGGCAP